jgi:hypothetical protein
MRLAIVAPVLWVAACDRQPPIASCSDDLHGVYIAGDREWNILDNRHSLEVYPMFDDTADPPTGIEIAPRVLDLRRTQNALAGEVTRRYMKGSKRCEAKAPARVTACEGNTLDIVLADPVAPISFEPCAWGQPASSRRERWQRR